MVRRLARRLDRIAKEGLEDLRRLLPAGRGGKPFKKEPIIAPGRKPVDAKPLEITRRTPESYARSAAIVEGVRDVGRAIGDFRLPGIPELRSGERRMEREDAIRRVVNDRSIKVTPAMMELINDDDLLITEDGELVRTMDRDRQFERQNVLPRDKPKRKVSPYQKELGRQLKMLKKKHPRTPIVRLMKRAHRLTKKALK